MELRVVYGKDAKYTIDDVPISSKTNTITDAFVRFDHYPQRRVSAAGKRPTVATDTSGVKTGGIYQSVQ